jgi:hypothetical protein
VQRGMVERNEATPVDQRFKFRIGVNLGDVIAEAVIELPAASVPAAAPRHRRTALTASVAAVAAALVITVIAW